MDGGDPHFASFLFEERQCLAAKTAAAVSGNDVELVDEGIVAVELEAEANGKDNIADKRRALVQQPNSAESRKRQELTEDRSRRVFVKRNGAGLVLRKSPHHRKKSRLVVETGFPK